MLGKRFERIYSLVQFMDSGKDKTDLLYLLDKIAHLKKRRYELQNQNNNLKKQLQTREGIIQKQKAKISQLSGALNLSKYFLENVNERIEQQRQQIKWLGMLVRRKGAASIEETIISKTIMNKVRREGEICD